MNRILIIGSLIFFAFTSQAQDPIVPTKTESSPFLGLSAAIYEVENLQAARDWYVQAFEVEPEIERENYVGFNINGYIVGFRTNEEQRCTKIESVACYWSVNKIQEVYDRLIMLGAKSYRKPYNVGGEMMLANVIDPFGNLIGLTYNPYSNKN